MEHEQRLAEEQAKPFAEDNPYAESDPFETSGDAIKPDKASTGKEQKVETGDLELDFQIENGKNDREDEEYEEQATETTVINHFENPFKRE